MAKGLCSPFDLEVYRAGHLIPVYFGSALNNLRVRELLDSTAKLRPFICVVRHDQMDEMVEAIGPDAEHGRRAIHTEAS